MAETIATKASFPKSGGLAVSNGAVSVNAGNGLHVNSSTGMLEVPVDTGAGLGYGSNGLEVEVDGETVDFNSSGQLTASGAALPFVITNPATSALKIMGWEIGASNDFTIVGLVGTKFLLITSIGGANLTNPQIVVSAPFSGQYRINGVGINASAKAVASLLAPSGNISSIIGIEIDGTIYIKLSSVTAAPGNALAIITAK